MGIYLEKISPNFHRVVINDYQLWFSYETIVAYRDKQNNLYCCENIWSIATEKHLKQIEPDPFKRISVDLFRKIIEDI
jgi:hypothetical protein